MMASKSAADRTAPDWKRLAVEPFRLGPLARLHRLVVRFLIFGPHRLEIEGAENLALVQAADPIVLIPNHVSHLDGVMWGCLLPPHVIMTINSRDSRHGYPAWLVRNHRVAVMDSVKPQSVRMLARIVRSGAKCLVFPEGRVTRTGDLHKVNAGAGIIADSADAPLMPIWADGPQLTLYSYLKGRVRRRSFPPFRYTLLKPRPLDIPDRLSGAARRKAIQAALEDMMEEARTRGTQRPFTVFGQFRDICDRVVIPSASAVEDDVDRKVTFAHLEKLSLASARRLRGLARPGEFVACIPSPTARGVAVLLGLQAAGLPTLILDAESDMDDMEKACEALQCKLLVADRGILAESDADRLEAGGIRVVWSDQLSEGAGGMFRRLGGRGLQGLHLDPQSPSLAFATRGSDGGREIVVLSHANVLANRAQAEARLSYVPGETIFSSAPLHLVEGLLAGVLLPLLSGCKIVLRAHPFSAKQLPASLSVACASVLVLDGTACREWVAGAEPQDATYVRRLLVTDRVCAELRRNCLEKLAVRPVPVLTDLRLTCFVAAPRVSNPYPDGYGIPLPTLQAESTSSGVAFSGDNVALGTCRTESPGVLHRFSEGKVVLPHIRAVSDEASPRTRVVLEDATIS